MTSERHEWFRRAYPSEPAPWQKASVRTISIAAAEPVCDCGKGSQGRVPCPTPEACLQAEPDTSRFDAEGRRQLRWLVGGIVLAVVTVVALLAGSLS
jgi:hypothetical protein